MEELHLKKNLYENLIRNIEFEVLNLLKLKLK